MRRVRRVFVLPALHKLMFLSPEEGIFTVETNTDLTCFMLQLWRTTRRHESLTTTMRSEKVWNEHRSCSKSLVREITTRSSVWAGKSSNESALMTCFYFHPSIHANLVNFCVHRNANKQEIIKAYRKLAQQWHPDNFQSETEKKEAEKKFIDIASAKEVLTDPGQEQRCVRHNRPSV